MRDVPIKRTLGELWDTFQSSELRGVFLDEYRATVMRYCFFAGVNAFLVECDRVGRAHRGEQHVVASYIERCQRETGDEVGKLRPRVRRGSLPE